MKRKIVSVMLIALICVSTIALVACGGEGSKSGGDTIKIGALGPYTGETAMYGVAAKEGMEIAVEEINKAGGIGGKKVEVVFYDTKGDPTEAVNAYNRLRDQDEVVALVGSVLTGESMAIKDLIKSDGMPTIAPTATGYAVTEDVPNYFRVCYYDEYQGSAGGNYAAAAVPDGMGAKNAAVLVSKGNAYSEGLAAAFTKSFEAKGGKIVGTESYSTTDKDFSAQLTKIKELNPDVLYIPDYYSTVGVVLQQAKDMGIAVKTLGGDGWDSIQAEYAAVAQDGLFTNHYAADSPNDAVKAFTKAYTDKHKKAPASFAALGYDAMNLMAQSIDKAGSTDKAKIVDAIKAASFKGVTGEFTFDENGNPNGKDVTIIKVDGGELKFVTTVKGETK